MRDGPRGFGQDSSCPALLRIPLARNAVTRTGLSPSAAHLSRWFHFQLCSPLEVLQPRCCLNSTGLGSSHFARHYSGNRLFLSLPAGTKMFQFPALALIKVNGLQPSGLPHSDTCGSMPVCSSPQLFAAYHVLLRLLKPRHPPSALLRFVILVLTASRLSPPPPYRIVRLNAYVFISNFSSNHARLFKRCSISSEMFSTLSFMSSEIAVPNFQVLEKTFSLQTSLS